VRETRLVRHHDDRQPEPSQPPERVLRSAAQADARGIDVVRNVVDERSVLVDEHGGCHGHELSRIGRTVISGTTVSSGSSSTSWIAGATVAGSCNVDGSMSGKRSSRNGVRIPPAITAVTLTPWRRASTWSAW